MTDTGEHLPPPPHAPPRPWHTLSIEETGDILDTGPDGLDSDEAADRLAHYGPNEVETEREEPWWRVLLHQFQDPLIYVLLAAAAVTLVLGDYKDTGVIAAVLVINAVIGFAQELRARAAIRGLARLAAPKAHALRDGDWREIESRGLVPGDIVRLTSGARVPADLRLTSVRGLEVDESALTGESMPVRKATDPLETEVLVPGDRTNSAFAGTVVTRGRARGIVVHTGAATELGRIATSVREIGKTATPLEEETDRLGRWVGWAVLGAAAIAFLVGVLRALSPGEIFLTVVALAVSVVPEGLPVVLTVTLAVGVRRMARRNAIIRALPAVETLGSTTAIGSDKTGTLTRNEMTVRALRTVDRHYDVTGTGYRPEGEVRVDGRTVEATDDPALFRLLLAGVLANEADAAAAEAGRAEGDPTEIALHVAAPKAGISPTEAQRDHPEIDLLPFEPERRFMATLNGEPDGGHAIYLKGAPEAVLQRCDRRIGMDGEGPLHRDAVREAARALGAEGLRVLAMAYRPADGDRLDEAKLDGGFVFAGLQAMDDPVRPEAVAAVAAAREAGIRVLMLTGDHLDTALAIGRAIGLDDADRRGLEGDEVERLSDEELDHVVREVAVYARVAPEHKLRLVERLKHQGEIVAVTGDGVNDAPALRAAHLGIAMGKGGTDVAREASDMVLADDNFATITAAVEEGRIVFSNIRKVTFFLLSTGVGEVFTILFALFAGWPLPFVAAQILWINLVTNGLQDVALAVEPGEPGLLGRPPRAQGEGILTRRIAERLGAVGAVLAIGTLGMFWWALTGTGDIDHARTIAMTQMVAFQFYHAFNSRSLERSVLRIPPFSNPYLFGGVLLALLAHLAVLYLAPLQEVFRTTPLAPGEWARIALVGFTVIIGAEIDKAWSRRRGRPFG